MATVRQRVSDLALDLSREAEFIHPLAPQRSLLHRVVGELERIVRDEQADAPRPANRIGCRWCGHIQAVHYGGACAGRRWMRSGPVRTSPGDATQPLPDTSIPCLCDRFEAPELVGESAPLPASQQYLNEVADRIIEMNGACSHPWLVAVAKELKRLCESRSPDGDGRQVVGAGRALHGSGGNIKAQDVLPAEPCRVRATEAGVQSADRTPSEDGKPTNGRPAGSEPADSRSLPASSPAPTETQDELEAAAADLLIQLSFLVPIGTDLGKTIGPALGRYKHAIEERAKAQRLTEQIGVLDRAGAYQALELRKAYEELAQLKAQAASSPAVEALVRPPRVDVSRCPDSPHRLILQFNDGPKYDLLVHQALSLIESLSAMTNACVPSLYEMELGVAERKRRSDELEAVLRRPSPEPQEP